VRSIKTLLERAVAGEASDLHIIVSHPPLLRVNTILGPIEGEPEVASDEAKAFAKEILSEAQYQRLQERQDLDFSTSLPGGPRFRVNAHYQRGTLAMAFRTIPGRVPPLRELNLPDVVVEFAELPQGLVLVTGETGSGKSTSLASMVDYINQRHPYHVITLEDPIEYFLKSDQCTIEQREVGEDVPDFHSGLKHVLRQDPDVILIGEHEVPRLGAAYERRGLDGRADHRHVPGGPAGPGPLHARQHPEGGRVPAAVSARGPAGHGPRHGGACLDAGRPELHPRKPDLRDPEHHRDEPRPGHDALRRVAQAALLQRHDQPRRRPLERPGARPAGARPLCVGERCRFIAIR
jgi:energy-coupling factor transporter ATP-binding protein EcfA2